MIWLDTRGQRSKFKVTAGRRRGEDIRVDTWTLGVDVHLLHLCCGWSFISTCRPTNQMHTTPTHRPATHLCDVFTENFTAASVYLSRGNGQGVLRVRLVAWRPVNIEFLIFCWYTIYVQRRVRHDPVSVLFVYMLESWRILAKFVKIEKTWDEV